MRRHDWKGGETVRFQYKTERSCKRCSLVKVTRHEPGAFPWIEWWTDGERLDTSAMPPCADKAEGATCKDQPHGI